MSLTVVRTRLPRISGTWTLQLPQGLSTSLSGRYAFADPGPVLPGEVDTATDRWGTTFSLSKPLLPELTGTLWLGYGNEWLLSFATKDATPDLQLGFRLLWSPKARTTVHAEADSLLKQTVTSAVTTTGSDTNLWTTSVHATAADSRGTTLAGTVTHHGRFADAVLSHTAMSDGFTAPDTQFTSLRFTTALAFADGSFAIGPAIRGGFAIVKPHSSIAGSEVIVGDLEAPAAKGTFLFPALLPSLPAYAETRFSLDATDLPLGYSLGTASLAMMPPYKAGYAVQVGSDRPLSVHGTLLDGKGAPVALTSGIVTPANAAAPRIPIFTNQAGRFGFEGLSEGIWTISLETADGHILYDLSIRKGDTALVTAGTLSPSVTVERTHAPPDPIVAPFERTALADGR